MIRFMVAMGLPVALTSSCRGVSSVNVCHIVVPRQNIHLYTYNIAYKPFIRQHFLSIALKTGHMKRFCQLKDNGGYHS